MSDEVFIYSVETKAIVIVLFFLCLVFFIGTVYFGILYVIDHLELRARKRQITEHRRREAELQVKLNRAEFNLKTATGVIQDRRAADRRQGDRRDP